MNDPQKLVAGALLAGAGLLTGEATLLAVAGGIGVNWSGEALAGLLRTFPSQPGELLARAYARAIRRAVDDLRQQYPHTGNACTLLPAFDLVAACAGEIGAAHLPATLEPMLPAVLEPGAIQAALAAGLDGLLFGHDEAEVAFLRRHLLPAVARAFAAELDGDDRAWRRYHGWLIEQTAGAFARFAAQPPAIASAVAPAIAPAVAPPVAPAPAAADEAAKAAEPAAPAPASLPDLGKVLAALADAEAVHARLGAAIARLEALYAGWLAALARSPGGPSAAFDNRGVQANTLVQGVEAYHQAAHAEGGGTATVINISGAALPPGALADLLAGKAGQLPAGAPATGGQAAGGQVTGAPAARPLSGAQLGELHAALLGAFTPDSLRQMVAFHLDESLDAIAGGPNFSAVVFALLDWAQRHGRLPELLAGAHAAVPGNARLTDALRAAGMAG